MNQSLNSWVVGVRCCSLAARYWAVWIDLRQFSRHATDPDAILALQSRYAVRRLRIGTHVTSPRGKAYMTRARYDRITTTIERQWLAQIIAGTKKIEYRQIKPYWTKRFAKVALPFELRLLNGMNPPVPEVTVLIHRVTRDSRAGEYQLHIKKVLGFKHWDKRRQKPER